MAWSGPNTWLVSDVPNANGLNLHIRDNLLFLYNAPSCKVRKSGSQGLTANVETPVTWQILDYQIGGTFWTSGANLTLPVLGHYLNAASVCFQADATGRRIVSWRAGGANNVIVSTRDLVTAWLPTWLNPSGLDVRRTAGTVMDVTANVAANISILDDATAAMLHWMGDQ